MNWKKGIDIYKYNPISDMALLAKSIDFIILQIGYGVSYAPATQKDPKFDERYEFFHGKIPVGIYWYAYGKNIGDGKKEAQNCLKYLNGRALELPIYYDIEDSSNRNHDAITREFVDTIRSAGYRAGVYTYTSYAREHMHLNKFSDCSLWMAAYGRNDGSTLDMYKPANADIWQYTSNGSVPGMPNRVDMNVMLNENVIMEDDDMTEAQVKQIAEKVTQTMLQGDGTKPSSWAEKIHTIDRAKEAGITKDGERPRGYATREETMEMCLGVLDDIKGDIKTAVAESLSDIIKDVVKSMGDDGK